MKVARYLQRTDPDLLPSPEPEGGFRSILEGSDPSTRYQLRAALAPGKLPVALALSENPRFEGSLTLIRIRCHTRRGELSLSPAELGVIHSYLRSAVPLLAHYLGDARPLRLTVFDSLPELELRPTSNRFSDANLLEGCRRLSASAGAGRAFLFLAPPSVVNADCDPAAGSTGYHAAGPVPYAYLPVAPGELSLRDLPDRFALALSHHLTELLCDPGADLAQLECCDPCAPNLRDASRNFFSAAGEYLGSGPARSAPQATAFFLQGFPRRPFLATAGLAHTDCGYAPPLAGGPP
ncbi:MAG: hypothetical protein L3K04_04170 [Thermoplasmata archaeon]|nr:hypothetical protein [Thermoplasmata archaeon]MCI4341077.1 hypothetical protein [Thermoplasmata archaeon]